MQIKEIGATARVSFEQKTLSGNVFYTFEASQKWSVEDEKPEDIPELNKRLWGVVNDEVTQQIIQIKTMYKQKMEQQSKQQEQRKEQIND